MNGQTVSDCALRCVVTALLMRVWSTAREHGKYVGDDLVFTHVDLADIDDIAGVSDFGDAMALVGWATVKDGESGVTLPNFKQYNVPVEGNAERQKAYRERQKSGDKARYSALQQPRYALRARAEQQQTREEKINTKQGEPHSPGLLLLPGKTVRELLTAARIGEPALSDLCGLDGITVDEVQREWGIVCASGNARSRGAVLLTRLFGSRGIKVKAGRVIGKEVNDWVRRMESIKASASGGTA